MDLYSKIDADVHAMDDQPVDLDTAPENPEELDTSF